MAIAQMRRKCFTYLHDDEFEVRRFNEAFDHARNVFIARGMGAGMPGDIIDSTVCYARWYHYPATSSELSRIIEGAYSVRDLIKSENGCPLFSCNRERQ
ncbi:hypothetical protein [Streptomyces sp. NPDC056165]|uniref:hypothetical protein n=1 Tax=Streptomyces sp. NPDC056165 TaxID=3345733 RepID=UPI0035DF77D2